MGKNVWALAVAAVVLVGVTVVCNSSTSPKAAKIFTASELAMTDNAVTGWNTTTISGSHAATYNDTGSFFLAIDGGAGEYWNAGAFTQAYIQCLGNSQDTVTCYLFSYANSSIATAEFNHMVLFNVNDSTTLAPFATSVALGDTLAMNYVKAFAHFGNCYFELTFHALDRARGIADAVQFLQVFESKINAN